MEKKRRIEREIYTAINRLMHMQ